MKTVKLIFMVTFSIIICSCKKADKIEQKKEKTLVVNTLAGSGGMNYAEGIGTAASFLRLQSLTVDATGNIYVMDAGRLRKITPSKVTTTLAGNGENGYADGTGTAAMFSTSLSAGIAIDESGNIYVSDNGNSCIRKVTTSGLVTTFAGTPGSTGFADGPAATAKFNGPRGICFDSSNNLYVADTFNRRVRKITPSGVVSTLIGDGNVYSSVKDGPIGVATIMNPQDIAIDGSGNIYVATKNETAQSNMVRKITSSGMVSTLAGSNSNGYINGFGLQSLFLGINGITVDESGNLYVSDTGNQVFRKITPEGYVSLFAGIQGTNALAAYSLDGPVAEARFRAPYDVFSDKKGNLYVTDEVNCMVRKISSIEKEAAEKSKEQLEKENWNKPSGWK